MSTAAPESASPTEENQTLPPGTLVAERYRIMSQLGEGGMGVVYLVEHVHMRKQFALKVLQASMGATEEIATRFEREAIAAGRIDHPNVAAATDFGKLPDGSFFLVLEYINGQTLRELIHKGRIAPLRAARIVHGVASALGAAHAKGVVHRDLKPENVMLVPRADNADFVKVLDFGIAKVEIESAASGAKPLTRVGAIFGTPDYMSPEQALGQIVDFRTDLYSIGIVLYELLTGERPFRGGAMTVLRQHVLDDAPLIPAELSSTLDPRLTDVVKRLLAKSPDQRPASANDLASELATILASPRAEVPREALGTMQTMVAADSSETRRGPPPEAAAALHAAPTRRSAIALMVAAAVLSGLIALGGAILVARAIWPTETRDHPATAADSAQGGVVLPPPPPPARSATAESNPPGKPAAQPAQNQGTSTAPANTATKGSKKETRRTGPGGIYIPPPSQWFN